jgi:hypothetical protein
MARLNTLVLTTYFVYCIYDNILIYQELTSVAAIKEALGISGRFHFVFTTCIYVLCTRIYTRICVLYTRVYVLYTGVCILVYMCCILVYVDLYMCAIYSCICVIYSCIYTTAHKPKIAKKPT